MNFTGYAANFPVTREDIKAARRRDPRRSPLTVAVLDHHQLEGWCVESTPERTSAYGYQEFGERRIFTTFSARHSPELEEWLDSFERGGKPEPVTVSAEWESLLERRFLFDIATQHPIPIGSEV